MKILIPTCRDREQVRPLVCSILEHSPGHSVFASCLKESASVNRNACLEKLTIGETAIMVDDDITGFYRGWIDDLTRGLMDFPNAVMASARLLKPNGKFGQTSSDCYAPEPAEIPVNMLPTAAIAFRYTGLDFDTRYVGSGWEDTDYVRQLKYDNPDAVLIQSNRCRLTHRNEMKHQGGANWEHNKAYFFSKWNAHAQHA